MEDADVRNARHRSAGDLAAGGRVMADADVRTAKHRSTLAVIPVITTVSSEICDEIVRRLLGQVGRGWSLPTKSLHSCC